MPEGRLTRTRQAYEPNRPWRDMVAMLRDEAPWLVPAVMAILVLFTVVGAVSLAKYRECRAHGFSFMYCTTR